MLPLFPRSLWTRFVVLGQAHSQSDPVKIPQFFVKSVIYLFIETGNERPKYLTTEYRVIDLVSSVLRPSHRYSLSGSPVFISLHYQIPPSVRSIMKLYKRVV